MDQPLFRTFERAPRCRRPETAGEGTVAVQSCFSFDDSESTQALPYDGSIDLTQPRRCAAPAARACSAGFAPVVDLPQDSGRLAVLFNQRAHRNRLAEKGIGARTWSAAPQTKAELDWTLSRFAQEKVNTVVIDGGDGTVRDVLSLASRHFGEAMPRFVVMPSGKTNALAADLGVASRWAVEDMLATLPRWRSVTRSPIEIRYGCENEPRLRGFVFGTGAYVRATALAQSVHRAGAFNGLAVGLSLLGALGQTLFGSRTNEWRRGDAVRIEIDGQAIQREFYLMLGSTLERMPLGLKPFGRERSGFKLLGVDAPPRKFLRSAAAVLSGSESEWISDAGCKRVDTDSFGLKIDGDFILDGEQFPGGDLTISKGAPLEFLVPA